MVDRYQPIDQQEPAGTTIFHPDSIPGGRRSRKKNWSGARCSVTCFFSTLGGLSLLLGCVVVYFIILFVRTAHIITPHSPLIWTPPTDNVSYVPADYEVVRPLINSTTPFDLLVTVWLDVTEHLDQGYRLPSPATPLQGQQQEGYKVVEYTLPDGTDMKEAVIYSDLLIRDVLIKDKVHQSVKLRLPIEPFYTQHLGPSTLRATFTLVPKRSVLEAYGTFNNSVSVYPVNAPIRPRRPSYLIHSGRTGTEEGDAEVGDAGGSFMAASNVEEAMDLSSFTASLLQLAPSGKSTKDAGLDLSPNLRLNRLRPSRIFDGDTYNRRFTHKDYPRPGGQGFYYVNPGEDLMVPFINSRSRVMFIKEDRLFQKPSFDHSQYQVRKELASCYPSTNASTWMTCSMDDQDKHVTTQLSFKKEKAEVGSNRGNEEAISPKGEFRHFYAPVLLPGHLASGPRHQLPIPLKRPTASPTDKTAARKASIVIKGGKEIQLCPPTELGVDSNLEFFEMDWDVFFSSHSLFWLAAFQSRDHAVPTLWEEEWEEDLKEGKGYLPTKTRMDHEKEWMLQGK
ncbi:hypothetical protein IE53DRAFT_48745 [Violaceomyces palustris]|uniref:Uncharacterized protein n=1 Tax=Violaceomyces palustris TaxID=1673888 RepID=A0ACD0P063_9BASI|nr:hypothetical protein IE53DRAFT_48745 [Violaceomyces palustris]